MIEHTLLIEPKETRSYALPKTLPEDPFERRALIPSLIQSLDEPIQRKALQELLCDTNELVSEYAAMALVASENRDTRLSITRTVIQHAPYLSARVLLKALNAELSEESTLLKAVLEDTSLDWRVRHQAGETYAATAPCKDISALHESHDETVHYYALKGLERFAAQSIPLYLKTIDTGHERLQLPAAYGLQQALKAIVHREQKAFWQAAREEFPNTHNLLGMTNARFGSLEQAALSFNAEKIALRKALIKHVERRLETVHRKARPVLERLIKDATSDFLYRAASAKLAQD